MTVYQKLQEVRAEFAKQTVKKTGKNKFSNYDYFELGDFLPEAQTKFKRFGLTPIITFDGRENATLTIYDNEDPTQTIVFTSPMGKVELKGANDCQNVGSAETYTRRYLYMVALELAEHDAVDETSGSTEITFLIQKITDTAKKAMDIGCGKPEIAKVVRNHLGVAKYDNITEDKADNARAIISDLEKMIEKHAENNGNSKEGDE